MTPRQRLLMHFLWPTKKRPASRRETGHLSSSNVFYRRSFFFNRFAVFLAFATAFFADFFAFSALFFTCLANFFAFRFAFLTSGFAAATALFAVATAFPSVLPTVSPISISVSLPGVSAVSGVSSIIAHLLMLSGPIASPRIIRRSRRYTPSFS